MRLTGIPRSPFAKNVHPSPEAVELAFGRLVALNMQKVGTGIGTPEQTTTVDIQ
jgi:hypothetical protein